MSSASSKKLTSTFYTVDTHDRVVNDINRGAHYGTKGEPTATSRFLLEPGCCEIAAG